MNTYPTDILVLFNTEIETCQQTNDTMTAKAKKSLSDEKIEETHTICFFPEGLACSHNMTMYPPEKKAKIIIKIRYVGLNRKILT